MGDRCRPPGKKLIRPSTAEMFLLGPYTHFCLGNERNLDHFMKTDTLGVSPQEREGLPPINFSWTSLVRAVVGKAAWQRPNGPHDEKFPNEPCPIHSRKPSPTEYTPHMTLSPRLPKSAPQGTTKSPKRPLLLRPTPQ